MNTKQRLERLERAEPQPPDPRPWYVVWPNFAPAKRPDFSAAVPWVKVYGFDPEARAKR
jgi:hypothetical protein